MHWRARDVTSRETVGGDQSPGSLHSARDTQRADNVIQLASRSSPARLNSGSKEGQLFIDERELGACCLFIAFLSVVGGLLVLFYCGFHSFNPQSVQYQVGSYADR